MCMINRSLTFVLLVDSPFTDSNIVTSSNEYIACSIR